MNWNPLFLCLVNPSQTIRHHSDYISCSIRAVCRYDTTLIPIPQEESIFSVSEQENTRYEIFPYASWTPASAGVAVSCRSEGAL
ncbi:MAG: hypothetical protein SVO26_06540, partial [Chloroflexota bacterium]|nr:hypothetical protein [Chloroflexota bacterium]